MDFFNISKFIFSFYFLHVYKSLTKDMQRKYIINTQKFYDT